MLARTMTERNVYIALRERVALMGYRATPCQCQAFPKANFVRATYARRALAQNCVLLILGLNFRLSALTAVAVGGATCRLLVLGLVTLWSSAPYLGKGFRLCTLTRE